MNRIRTRINEESQNEKKKTVDHTKETHNSNSEGKNIPNLFRNNTKKSIVF